MNHTAYLTPHESRFQIPSQLVKPFNLEVGEHRDIESQHYYTEGKNLFGIIQGSKTDYGQISKFRCIGLFKRIVGVLKY